MVRRLCCSFPAADDIRGLFLGAVPGPEFCLFLLVL